jgi:hypothetical protein
LDPAECVITWLDPRIPSFVIPAKAGIQLHAFGSKLDPDFRQGDDREMGRYTNRNSFRQLALPG